MAARKRVPSSGPRLATYKGLRIHDAVINRAVPANRLAERYDPFSASPRMLHPPGVRIAMDDAYSSFSGTSGWSVGGLNAAIAEGQIFLGYPTLAALMQRVEYMNAIMSLADDMTRKWIDIKAKAGVDKSERIEDLKDKFEVIKLEAEMKSHIVHALGFGRAHLYLDTGDTDDRDELKHDLGFGARSASSAFKMPGQELIGVRPIEPVWVSPHDYETSNPLKPNWYRPNAWHVMATEVHASRLLTTIPFPVPDLLKPAYRGLPLVQLGKPYVDNWLNVRQSTTDIVQSYSIFALATNLSATLGGGADDEVDKRVALFNRHRNNKGAFVYDKETEDFKNISANIAGVEAIQAASQEHMSAAWRIPLVKLTGISPSGLNASSEGEIRVYYDLIKSLQEQFLRPHLQIVMDLCEIELFGDVDSDITFDFVKLFEVTEIEAAQIRSADAQTGTALIQNGVVDPVEERARVANDPDSPYIDLDPMKLPAQAQPQPGDPDYTGEPDNWTTVMSGIRDTGGLVPPPEPDGRSSSGAWAQVMTGIQRYVEAKAAEHKKGMLDKYTMSAAARTAAANVQKETFADPKQAKVWLDAMAEKFWNENKLSITGAGWTIDDVKKHIFFRAPQDMKDKGWIPGPVTAVKQEQADVDPNWPKAYSTAWDQRQLLLNDFARDLNQELGHLYGLIRESQNARRAALGPR